MISVAALERQLAAHLGICATSSGRLEPVVPVDVGRGAELVKEARLVGMARVGEDWAKAVEASPRRKVE